MRLGLLADAHGNAEGLAACLTLLHFLGVDKIVFLGDAVGYFPYGAATCALLLKAGALCLMGNHEAMLWGILLEPAENKNIYRLQQSARHLPASYVNNVIAQGASCRLEVDGKRILCVHGTPDRALDGRQSPEDVEYHQGYDAIFLAHTHRPWTHTVNGQVWINPGSCGYPRDHGTLLSCAVFDTQRGAVQLLRVPFVFRKKMLRKAHGDVVACTERTCDELLGSIWK